MKDINDLLHDFDRQQLALINKIDLNNKFNYDDIKSVAGIDLAYWQDGDKNYAVCCIAVVDYKNHKILETKYLLGEINVPYIPGYLSFRELTLIIETYKLLEMDPDIVMFDGNGFLHYKNMGIATHASFYIKKPTIGVAKSYLKIGDVDYTMPNDEAGTYTDIVINDKVYGRAVRTHKSVKPIFVSCGNWVDLDMATNIVLKLINKDSRLPIPIRYADIETRKKREILQSKANMD